MELYKQSVKHGFVTHLQREKQQKISEGLQAPNKLSGAEWQHAVLYQRVWQVLLETDVQNCLWQEVDNKII